MRTLKAVTEELAGKSKILAQVFQEAGPDLDMDKVKSLGGDSKAKAEAIRQGNEELAALGRERDELLALEVGRKAAEDVNRQMNQPAAKGGAVVGLGGKREAKSIGQLFVESQAYQTKRVISEQAPGEELPGLDMKSLFYTGAGLDPQDIRIPRLELFPTRPIVVAGNIPLLPTSESSVVYMEETTFTNNAVEKAEATAVADADIIGESAFAFTERTVPVEWLPVMVPVTMQQLEDVEGIQAYLNNRLPYQLQARLDLQILQGTGATPLLRGTNNVVGINTQAKGADPTPDAIYKAMTKVRVNGFAEPNVMFIHPNDWQDVRLLRTTDGIYIFGNPTEAGPDRIWGMPVVATTAALENTATLGDYRNFSTLYQKRGITIAMTDSHRYFFSRGTVMVRADMRVAMVHFRPLAFATVTGI